MSETIKGLMAIRKLHALAIAEKAWQDGTADGSVGDLAAAYVAGQGWIRGAALVSELKAGVGGTTDAHAIMPSVLDIAEASRPLSVVDRLPGVVRLPFYSRTLNMSPAATAHWTGQGLAIPMSGVVFGSPTDLAPRKIGALLVTTSEFLRDGRIEAQMALRNELVQAIVAAMDRAFLDPLNSGDATMPVSITSGGESTASTGSSIAQIDADLGNVVDDLIAAGSNLSNAAWVVHPRSAAFLSKLRGSGGNLAYPTISVSGGSLLGLPVLVSGAMPVTANTAATTSISLIDGSGVLLADDGSGELSLSRDASLEMDGVPTGDSITPAGATANLVSLFQADAVAIRAIRRVAWLPRRATVASTLVDVSY